MRVAVDTNALYTGQAGIARQVRGFLSGLRAFADQVEAIPLAWEVENLAYRQPARAFKTAYRELFWGKTIAPWRLRRMGVEIYHATGSHFVSVPRSIPCVVTLHDLAVLRTPRRFRRWQAWSETRRLRSLHQVDRVICISRFTADEARALLGLPANKLEVVHNGGDFKPNEPIVEELPSFPVPNEFFLFVGSLEPGKNLVLLRETYQLAQRQGVTLPPLLIVGARWAGLGTEGPPPANWHYLGRQPDAVLVYLYRRALALVFPSKYEGFGLPVVEAMALGCPVLCSPVASLPEVGGKAVLWSEMTAPGYLAGMRQLASETTLRDELIRAGRVQAAQFTWENCARGVLEVYRAVSGKR